MIEGDARTEYMREKELAEELGVVRETVRRKRKLGMYLGFPIGKAPNGKPVWGILLASVPELQRRAAVARPAEMLPVSAPELISETIPLSPDGVPDLAALRAGGDHARADNYDMRMRAVTRVRSLLAGAKYSEKMAIWQRVADEVGVAPGTLRGWVNLAKEAGPAALVPAASARRGTHPSIPKDLALQLRQFHLNRGRADAMQAFRYVAVPWAKNGGRELPRYKNVYRFIKKHIRPIEGVGFREGERAFAARMLPKVIRERPEPGQVWCADHRLCDLLVLEDGKPCRPWLTAIADVGSAAWVGYVLSRQPNAAIVALALRRALRDFGCPAMFVRDNGREFCASRLGGKAARLRKPGKKDLADRSRWPAALPAEAERDLFGALGVKVVTALPYSAWSKPIESYFGAFSRRWENLVPGYCGRDAKRRPEILRTHVAQGKLLTWQEFEKVFAEQVADWNENHVVGDRPAPPLAMYAGHRGPVPAAETVAFLSQKSAPRRVRPEGVTLDGEVWSAPGLAVLVGLNVPCRWDVDGAFAYVPDGRAEKPIQLRPVERAVWGAFNGANEAAKRGAKLQREHLRSVAAELRGACTPDQLDPTGAFRVVAERLCVEGADQAAAAQGAAVRDKARREAGRYPEPNFTVYDLARAVFRCRHGDMAEFVPVLEAAYEADTVDDLDERDAALDGVAERLRSPSIQRLIKDASLGINEDGLGSGEGALAMFRSLGLIDHRNRVRRRIVGDVAKKGAAPSVSDPQLDASRVEACWWAAKDLVALEGAERRTKGEKVCQAETRRELTERLAGLDLAGADADKVRFLRNVGLLTA